MYERTYHKTVLKQDSNAKKQKPFPWKLFLFIVGIVFVVVGIVLLIKLPKFQVSQIHVEGTHVADPMDVSQSVMALLQGQHLWILPKSSIFLVSTSSISHAVLQSYPRFKTIEVTRDSMHSLRVVVSEYTGLYLWCDSDQVCSFMDEQGTVFADAPYFSGNAYLKIYKGERKPYPFDPLDDQERAKIALIQDRLKAIDVEPISFLFISEHNLSVVFDHSKHDANIIFDPAKDTEAALDILYSALRTEPLSSQYRDASKVLEYLDVRFGNKVIYKFH